MPRYAVVGRARWIVAGVVALCWSAVSVSVPASANAQMLRIVGSSTVFPFAAVVAETFGRSVERRSPMVESTGTGGGLKLFCASGGAQSPDMTNASRRIKPSEYKKCRAQGVRLLEVKVGYDGIVIAHTRAAPQMALTLRTLYLALAAQIPNGACARAGCAMQANPHERWSDIDSALPPTPIEVLGPPPTSGTRDAFLELAMEAGARSFAGLAALRKQDKKAFQHLAHRLRDDGRWVDAGENDNLIVQKLVANRNALGVFGFSFLDENRDRVRGIAMDGVRPRFAAIASGAYPIARSLYVYARVDGSARDKVRQAFLQEFVSSNAVDGEDGYLVDRGLIPLSAEEQNQMRARVMALEELRM